jgi:hypothetical protein
MLLVWIVLASLPATNLALLIPLPFASNGLGTHTFLPTTVLSIARCAGYRIWRFRIENGLVELHMAGYQIFGLQIKLWLGINHRDLHCNTEPIIKRPQIQIAKLRLISGSTKPFYKSMLRAVSKQAINANKNVAQNNFTSLFTIIFERGNSVIILVVRRKCNDFGIWRNCCWELGANIALQFF